MFGPRHTFKSVARELIDGLEKGTIILNEVEQPEELVARVQIRLVQALASARRRTIWLMLGTLVFGFVGLSVSIVSILTSGSEYSQSFHANAPMASLIVGTVAGILAALVYALIRARESTVELKTIARMLKLVDETTAQRIAWRFRSKLKISRVKGSHRAL